MIDILPTDEPFTTSLDAGDPDCTCSRCGQFIAEGVLPIRLFDALGAYEYRYHPECVGLELLELGDDGNGG